MMWGTRGCRCMCAQYLVLSCHLYVGSGGETEDARLVPQVPLPVEPFHCPCLITLKNKACIEFINF